MSDDIVNIRDAKARLLELLARAENEERITIARDGKPVAELGPVPKRARRGLRADEPLLSLEKFALDGPGGDLSNEAIDRKLYGRS